MKAGDSAQARKRGAAKQADPEQSRRFIEKARELGADDENSGVDELLGHLRKKPPEPHAKKRRSG
jgi:hypothetical protein